MDDTGSSSGSGEVPGLDLGRFRAWYDRQRPGEISGPLRAEVVAGGKSNLTYVVTDGTGSWVVRRPPLGHVLATAHDMGREHTVISALRETAVPVPETYAMCADADVIGAPFYVMQWVPGTPYRYASQLDPLGADRVREISTRMVRTLGALHAVDPASVGLSEFGRPEGFLARQVRRWNKQLEASRSRDLAGAEELHDLLERHIPAEQTPAVVHGDYRLDNILVDEQDTLRAVVDWEMATLGDPLTDVALLLVYGRLAALGTEQSSTGSGTAAVVSDAATAPGFLSEDEALETYAAASGRDVTALGFYVGLAYFKLAVVLEGIHYRYLQGQTVGEGFDSVGTVVEPLLARGLDAVRPLD